MRKSSSHAVAARPTEEHEASVILTRGQMIREMSIRRSSRPMQTRLASESGTNSSGRVVLKPHKNGVQKEGGSVLAPLTTVPMNSGTSSSTTSGSSTKTLKSSSVRRIADSELTPGAVSSVGSRMPLHRRTIIRSSPSIFKRTRSRAPSRALSSESEAYDSDGENGYTITKDHSVLLAPEATSEFTPLTPVPMNSVTNPPTTSASSTITFKSSSSRLIAAFDLTPSAPSAAVLSASSSTPLRGKTIVNSSASKLKLTPSQSPSTAMSTGSLVTRQSSPEMPFEDIFRFSEEESIDGDLSVELDHQNCSVNGLEIKTRGRIKTGCKKVYDKLNYCVFCNTAVGKISRHLLTVHKREEVIMKINEMTKGSQARKTALTELSMSGNFKHNGTVLEAGKGEVVVGRRSVNALSVSNYLPCSSCNVFFNKRSLSRHVRKCRNRKVSGKTIVPEQGTSQDSEPGTSQDSMSKRTAPRVHAFREGRMLMNSMALPEGDNVILGELFLRMNDDPIKTIVVGDQVIRRFAALKMESLGQKRFQKLSDVYRVSNSARLLARVLEMARVKLGKNNLTMDELIVPTKIDVLVEIGRALSTEKDTPSLNVGRSVGFVLGHVARTKLGIALRKSDKETVGDLNSFLLLLESEWNQRVNAAAAKQMNAEKRSKVRAIPVTEDLQKLRNHLLTEMARLVIKLKENPKPKDWSNLAGTTMSRLIMFNKRRRAEVMELTVSEYLNRPKWNDDMSGEMLLALDEKEKKLASRMDMVVSAGKSRKNVDAFVMLPPDSRRAIDILNKTRARVGVPATNPFIFARMMANTPLAGHTVLKDIVKSCSGLKFPERVTSRNLRRYIATVSQIVGMDDKEIEQLARHLGHDAKTHKEFYKLSDSSIQLSKYIRRCLSLNQKPELMLMSRDAVYKNLPKNTFVLPSYVKRGLGALQEIASQPTVSLWTLNALLRIKINVATYVNVREKGEIYVRAAVYHGTESLCPPRDTKSVISSNPKWNEWLDFELSLRDIPRSARLCLSLCSISRRQKRRVHYAIAWANINLFDFTNRLLSDKLSVKLWPMPTGFDEMLYPIGIPGSNTSTDAPCIEIEFDKYGCVVSYPNVKEIEEYAKGLIAKLPNPKDDVYSEYDKEQIEVIIRRDPLSEISEQEKVLLWQLRYYCMSVPESLPKLLVAVKWNNRDDVSQLYQLLKTWPVIHPQSALQLLYCSHTDLVVRNFAVECLDEKLTDDQLSRFLLQIVQVLEFEPYIDNRLTQFLLRRALLSQRIGHLFFWYLRSSMHILTIRLRFGLILEAYYRSCGSYHKPLLRQVEAVEKLTRLSDMLKEEKEDVQIRVLRNQIRAADFLEALQNFPSPLNYSHILGELLVDQCDVKISKKRPLFLAWKNPDAMAKCLSMDFQIIFKSGDDLRQDMLTLQVIGIMDTIWQDEGLDLRMMPYRCLSTGLNVGMIEVVRNAKTVMHILKQDIRSAMMVRSKELHSWIKEKAKTRDGLSSDAMYNQAIDTFTRSCAGYCVATFILGIGDRHPSNIMVTESGQVFHIDFGHFLDHRKKKFGINRERVPFVLTEDFIRVIAKGQDNPEKSAEFSQFMELCGKAYLSLRKHASIFVTLFTMMLSCGIPELQSLDDISYIRNTLKVDCKTEQEALDYFQRQFSDAYGGAWTTKLDWFFHWIKHRNS